TSDSEIVATAPPHAAGPVDVIVSNVVGSSAATPASQFTYVSPPVVTAVNPTSGSTLGGAAITITGAGFAAGARVVIGGADATGINVVSATSVTATTPAHAAGVVGVQVINPDGQSDTLPSSFTYITPPAVTSLAPTSGSTAGGTLVTITGSAFVSGATVTFDGVPASGVTFINSTSLRATSPAHPAGAVAVAVTNPNGLIGTLAGGYSFVDPVTAAPAPATSITVQTGSLTSGNAASLATNDGQYATVSSSLQGLFQATVSFYGEYVVPEERRDIIGLTIDYDGGASASGYNRTISLFNFETGAWEVLRTEAQTTSDRRTAITIAGDPSRFLSSTGQVRMRIRAVRTGLLPTFNLRGDLMTFTVTYVP
ncbi:MAG: IPT/TIG domain-containing protein, partial [Vicinamibacterales bacterium]